MSTRQQTAFEELYGPLVDSLTLCLRLEDPWRLANSIVEETARRYEAAISTLFRVEGNHLWLMGGVLLVDDRQVTLQRHSYELHWEAKTWSDLAGQGVTSGVAVFNEALPIRSFAELRRNPAHVGRWDSVIYPDGPDHPVSGFGCMHAVPLRLRDRGRPKDIVAGVFKIERRRNRPAFLETERAAFATVATHLNYILRTSQRVKTLVLDHATTFLRQRTERHPSQTRQWLPAFVQFAEELAANDVTNASVRTASLERLRQTLPEIATWQDEAATAIARQLGYEPPPASRRFLTVLKRLDVAPLQVPRRATASPVIRRVEEGFRSLTALPDSCEAALLNLARWMDTPQLSDYLPQLIWLVDTARWDVLLDSFHRVLPFGTGGRRGPVGIGTNRFNQITLASSVQGHVDYLRERYPDQDLAVVIAYDVRQFTDLRLVYNPSLPNPLLGITSKQFAHIAAGVYAANSVRAYILPDESTRYVSTPELSFTIRRLRANGGLNISASHNHPDDNGGKFFGAHGGQEVPPDDESMSLRVEQVDKIASLPLEDAKRSGLIYPFPAELHEEYVRLNIGQSLHPRARAARVVFTPLHGTGDTTVGEVLRGAGFEVHSVPEQSTLDGTFPGVPFRAPNPEVPESMRAGTAMAQSLGADIVFACDPDADRIGVTARDRNGEYQFLTGNEIAVIVANHKLTSLRDLARLPKQPLVLKTEVTTELLRPITESFGGTIIGDLLVGFKYHANVLNHLETAAAFRNLHADLADFVIAVEESHGVLVTPELRDKDAAGAAILLAELVVQQRDKNRTIVDYLDDIYLRFGYYANLLVSTVMTGAEGFVAIQKIQHSLRVNPPTEIAGLRVTEVVDHQDPSGVHGPVLSESDRLSRDVLLFRLEGGARLIIRPSGTEPKNKIYVEVPSPSIGSGGTKETLAHIKGRTTTLAQSIADDFTNRMLAIIGVELPPYALRISGLVPLDRRVAFAREFVPALESQIDALCGGRAGTEQVASWIDLNLRSYGEDARGLVADAVRTYVDEERRRALALPIEERARRTRSLDAMNEFFV